jgi:hypothetical protein
MYLRNVKQYVKNAAPSYDERRFGFANFLEAVRAAGRAGLFRLERNRQGILRIFAGGQFPRSVSILPQGVNGEVSGEPEVVDAVPVIEESLLPETPAEAMDASEPADVSDSNGEPFVLSPEQATVEGEPEPHRAHPKRRTRAAAPAKKKSTAGRKTKKKSTGDHDAAG